MLLLTPSDTTDVPGPATEWLWARTADAQRVDSHGRDSAAQLPTDRDTVLLLLTALGAATLLHSYPALFVVVKYAGAAYLAWLGIGLIRDTFRKGSAPATASTGSAATEAAAPAAHPFRRALLISLLNPKAILFLLSFFVQFIDPSYPTPALPFLILSAIVMLFSALYLSALIVAGAHLAQVFRARRRLAAGLASGVGVLFVGFGVKLATASL